VKDIKKAMELSPESSMKETLTEALEFCGIDAAGLKTPKDKAFACARELDISTVRSAGGDGPASPVPPPPPPLALVPFLAPPPPGQVGAAPQFRSARQEETHHQSRGYSMEVAAGELAKITGAVLQGYTGNLPGLFGSLAKDLANLTLSFSFAQEDSKEEKVGPRGRGHVRGEGVHVWGCAL